MSCHVIYYKDGAKMMRPVRTREEYLALRGSEFQRTLVEAIRKGDDGLKHKLVQMNYSCLPGEDGRLKGATQVSDTIGMDVDHIPMCQMEQTRERILSKKDELGLLMLELSARGQGFHLVFRRRPGLSQEENLRWASRILGVEYDKGAKDITRVFFTTTASKEDLIFLDDGIFETTNFTNFTNSCVQADLKSDCEVGGDLKSPIKDARSLTPSLTPSPSPARPSGTLAERSGARKGEGSGHQQSGGQTDGRDTSLPYKEGATQVTPCEQEKNSSLLTLSSSLCFKGIPYAEIIRRFWDKTGGEPVEGERNDRLHKLAAHLRYITDNDEALLLKIMPRYGLCEEEMKGLIHSACSSRFYSMPKLLQEIINENSLTPNPSPTGEGSGYNNDDGKENASAPELPKRLPRLIQLLTSRTPDIYKAAVAHAVFPALAAHLHQTRFRYIDNVEHEATLMNVLMAGTGAGKDCITAPINHIMADIRKRDAENLAREKAWKDEVNRRGANKDKRQRPEGLVIQEIDADMTGPAFVMRMAEADGHFLYTKLNEIDQFDALRGNAKYGQQFQIMCLSFDPDNRYGQTRVGTQSVTEKVTVRFNWNATTTIKKGQRYFERVLTDGPISRINFCTIPEREIGAPMPIYGTYDADFDEELRPYIERLCAARGTIDCPQAFRLIGKLKDECAEFARLSQSRTYENLSFRALVIAYLKACVLYVAHDYQWDKTIADFVRWSLHYDLWCKMQFFGAAIERANSETTLSKGSRPRNLLELLPDEFTMEDAIRVRREQGLSSEGTKDMLRVWRNRKYIVSASEGEQRTNEQCSVYVKLKFKK